MSSSMVPNPIPNYFDRMQKKNAHKRFLLGKCLPLAVLVVLLVPHKTTAQRKELSYQTPALLLEISTKAAAYRGDLSKGFTKWDASFGAALRLNRKKRVNFYVEVFYGNMSGQDIFFEPAVTAPGVQPNTFFRTSIFTGSANIQYNFFKNEFLTVFLSQGAGLLRYAPKDADGELLSLQVDTRLETESYTNNTVFLPTQIGAIYYVRSGFGVGLRGGLFNPMTDYLDNISELGSLKGNDNALTWTLSFLVPLEFDYGRRRR